MEKDSLVIITGHRLLSDLLENLFKEHGFASIRSFPIPDEGLTDILANPPTLVILDLMLPHINRGMENIGDHYHPYLHPDSHVTTRFVKAIRIKCPNSKIIILNGERHPNTYQIAFFAGADGIASKHEGVDVFLNIYNRIRNGEKSVTSPMIQQLVNENKSLPTPTLTDTEIRILQLIQEGLENHQIGELLGYSEKTIRNLLTRIYKKFGASNRYQALGLAMDMGLLGWRTGYDGS